MDDFQRKQIRKLRSEGLGYQSIGKIVGLSRDSVRNYCKRNPELLGYRNAVTKMMKDQASGLPCCLHCKETFIPKGTGRPKKFVRMPVGDTGGRTIQNYTRNKIQLTMNWLANIAVSLFYHTAMRSGNFVAMPAIFNLVFTKEVV
mgnify:CR=1 FL=1